ncbi:MAG TPA: hypothetical protein VN515_10420 [Terriglobales bacterium]|nr:hypothetical protein [Terriglobales bacterium]
MDESPSIAASPRNGAGAAALLAAGWAAAALAVLAILADRIPTLGRWMTFYRPTGPLSGVTTSAIVLWLAAWMLLHRRWRRRDVALGRIVLFAFALLVVGLLLTFPPLADVF